MKIWNTYKVWLFIGLTYAGFYFFIGFKALIHMVSMLHTKLFSSQALSKKES